MKRKQLKIRFFKVVLFGLLTVTPHLRRETHVRALRVATVRASHSKKATQTLSQLFRALKKINFHGFSLTKRTSYDHTGWDSYFLYNFVSFPLYFYIRNVF